MTARKAEHVDKCFKNRSLRQGRFEEPCTEVFLGTMNDSEDPQT
jgi:hypothetical protein